MLRQCRQPNLGAEACWSKSSSDSKRLVPSQQVVVVREQPVREEIGFLLVVPRPFPVRGSYSARVPRSSLAEVRRVLVTHIMEEGEDQEDEKDERKKGGQEEAEGRIAESQNNHIMSA